MSTIIQTPNSPNEGFEESVLEAAQAQADRIVAQAKKDAETLKEALLTHQEGDPVAAHEPQLAAQMRRNLAAAKQSNTRRLLIYRKQLVNGLFAEAKEQLGAFTATPAYTDFLCKTLGAHADKAAQGCTVYLRAADLGQQDAIAKVLPGAQFAADPTIALGGGKVRCGRVLFDETLDDRLVEQRDRFLARCNLHVSAKELGEAE